MQFGNSAGNFGGSAFRRPFGHGSADGLSKLVARLPNPMQIVHNWSGKLGSLNNVSNKNCQPNLPANVKHCMIFF